MKSVGQMLCDRRKEKKLTLDDVEKATKIRLKFLQAIEKDEFKLLPSINYAKGFVKNYSEYLGLNSRDVLAFFRRQQQEIPRSAILPKALPETLRFSPFRLTPGRFIGLIVGFFILIFLGYFVLQYRNISLSPNLIISSPNDKLNTENNIQEIIGQTDSDATLTINGVSVLVRSDGKFFEKVNLNKGTNTIKIVATSRFGKSYEKVIEIFLNE